MTNGRDPIVSGPEKWRWPWSRAQDVNIGSATRTQNSTVNLGSGARSENSTVDNARPAGMPRFKGRINLPSVARLQGGAAPAGWKRLLVTVVVLPALLFHIAPQIALLIGPDDAREFLAWLFGRLPVIDDFDAARWLTPAAAAWMWQPIVAAGGAGLLRLVALNTAKREPVGALWIAFLALVIDAATWLFMGLKLQGQAFDAAQAAALVTLLKVEAAALFVAFVVLAPTGRRRLGQTDADWAGDN